MPQLDYARCALFTGADSNYFGSLIELIESTASFFPKAGIPLHVLDLGLKSDERRQLTGNYPFVVVKGDTAEKLAASDLPSQPNFARLLLRELAPGYDVYLWIDSDIWFQQPDSLRHFLQAAWSDQLAMVPELDRAYADNFLPDTINTRQWAELHCVTGFGPLRAEKICDRPLLNSGLLAIRADCPLWETWLRYMREGSAHGLTSDQAALNLAIYESHFIPYFLPATYNWMCNRALPYFDGGTLSVRHPLTPHEPLIALHVAGMARKYQCEISRPGGRKMTATLGYRDVQRVLAFLRETGEE